MTLSFLSTMLLTEISVLGNLQWERAYFKSSRGPYFKGSSTHSLEEVYQFSNYNTLSVD